MKRTYLCLPGAWMAREPWFRMEHIFLLGVATSWLQAGVSYFWLRAVMRGRLDFSREAPRASSEPPEESRSPAA